MEGLRKESICSSCNKRLDQFNTLVPCYHSLCVEESATLSGKPCPVCETVVSEVMPDQIKNLHNTILEILEHGKLDTGTAHPCLVEKCSTPATLYCQDDDEYYCDKHSMKMHKHGKRSEHKIVPIGQASAKPVPKCVVHTKENLIMFCSLCSVPVCRDCVISDHRNEIDHKLIPLDEGLTERKRRLDEECRRLQDASNHMQQVIEEATNTTTKVANARDSAILSSQLYFDGLIAELANARDLMISDIQKDGANNIASLTTFTAKISSHLRSVDSIANLCRTAIQDSDTDVWTSIEASLRKSIEILSRFQLGAFSTRSIVFELEKPFEDISSETIKNAFLSTEVLQLGSLAEKIKSDPCILFSWGSNSYGELGTPIGFGGNCNFPQQVHLAKTVLQISAGFHHSLALTEGGVIFSWGNNVYGELGLGDNKNYRTPMEITNLQKAIQISAGGGFSYAVVESGALYGWGCNLDGELGISEEKNFNVPQSIPKLRNVTHVSAGHTHSIALTKNGTLYSWGLNKTGQLGLGNNEAHRSVKKIKAISKVVKMQSGKNHSLALTEDGILYSWGSNKSGELGLGDTKSGYNTPQPVNLNQVSQIGAGEGFSMAITKEGKMYGWGKNNLGQLASDAKDVTLPTPVKIPGDSVPVSISCGHTHSIALMSSGELYVWGGNKQGQLGLGDNVSNKVPQIVKPGIVVQTSAGGHHTLVMVRQS
eukprot:TRINITY_DN6629_c0_g1_i1.p1 TRINITY_DN6629_c0_g1~~TRINITY_DN6629_c0_g1_i1.p1  ORF type:complete len:710 (+),score=178.62 TRINITY_DN6629_c0_g1_i1:33-2162(+)